MHSVVSGRTGTPSATSTKRPGPIEILLPRISTSASNRSQTLSSNEAGKQSLPPSRPPRRRSRIRTTTAETARAPSGSRRARSTQTGANCFPRISGADADNSGLSLSRRTARDGPGASRIAWDVSLPRMPGFGETATSASVVETWAWGETGQHRPARKPKDAARDIATANRTATPPPDVLADTRGSLHSRWEIVFRTRLSASAESS